MVDQILINSLEMNDDNLEAELREALGTDTSDASISSAIDQIQR